MFEGGKQIAGAQQVTFTSLDMDFIKSLIEDSYLNRYVDLKDPLHVFFYIIFCIPPLLMVLIGYWWSIPQVLRFLHWAPKLLAPQLLGFPELHDFLRRLTFITFPVLPNIWDILRYGEEDLKQGRWPNPLRFLYS